MHTFLADESVSQPVENLGLDPDQNLPDPKHCLAKS
jgi:hypothetical protein